MKVADIGEMHAESAFEPWLIAGVCLGVGNALHEIRTDQHKNGMIRTLSRLRFG